VENCQLCILLSKWCTFEDPRTSWPNLKNPSFLENNKSRVLHPEWFDDRAKLHREPSQEFPWTSLDLKIAKFWWRWRENVVRQCCLSFFILPLPLWTLNLRRCSRISGRRVISCHFVNYREKIRANIDCMILLNGFRSQIQRLERILCCSRTLKISA
jgi:hypothetical protein